LRKGSRWYTYVKQTTYFEQIHNKIKAWDMSMDYVMLISKHYEVTGL